MALALTIGLGAAITAPAHATSYISHGCHISSSRIYRAWDVHGDPSLETASGRTWFSEWYCYLEVGSTAIIVDSKGRLVASGPASASRPSLAFTSLGKRQTGLTEISIRESKSTTGIRRSTWTFRYVNGNRELRKQTERCSSTR